MKVRNLHKWKCSYKDAVAIQNRLRDKIAADRALDTGTLRTVAGADISYAKRSNLFFAAVIVLDYESMDVVEEKTFVGEASFPYIPGLLSFREGPHLIRCFRKIKTTPDVVIFDGQGIAHPRGIGIASHMGLVIDVPSIGCGKTRLCGEHEPVGGRRGDFAPLIFKEEQCGVVLRTKSDVKPLFISPGHRIDYSSAVAVTLACCRGYRLPEPVRQAHLLVNRLRKKYGGDRKSPKCPVFEKQ